MRAITAGDLVTFKYTDNKSKSFRLTEDEHVSVLLCIEYYMLLARLLNLLRVQGIAGLLQPLSVPSSSNPRL